MNTHFNPRIERIICPFDFTETGRTGLEYAAILAHSLNARLTIFYVQPSVWPEALQLYEDLNDSTKGVKRHIQVEAESIAHVFDVRCDYAIEPTNDSIALAVGAVSADYDLIVMGTTGADDLYQHVFGINTHHALGLAKCPVLMIPPGYRVRLPKLILYVFDPETHPASSAGELDSLSQPLRAEVRAIHVLPEPGVTGPARKMELLGEVLGVREGRAFDWGFEPVYSDGIVHTVDEYIKDHRCDVLALSYHHRNLFEKLFLENVSKDVSRIADYPVLVFWH